jgi:anti-anti-sigma factor
MAPVISSVEQDLSEPSLLVDVQDSSYAGSPRIALTGELDQVSASRLRDAVVKVLRDQRPGHVELDLTGVSYLDSGGILALLVCRADGEQLSCRVTLANPQPHVRRVLEIAGLLNVFGMSMR